MAHKRREERLCDCASWIVKIFSDAGGDSAITTSLMVSGTKRCLIEGNNFYPFMTLLKHRNYLTWETVLGPRHIKFQRGSF